MNDEREDQLDNDTENQTNQEGKSSISSDLIRGHINTIILRTLSERDKYGYEIIEEIESKSHGQYSLKQPTLYSALKRLENQGYINAYWKNDEVSSGGRRKYYTLTDSGKEIAEKNQSEWEYSRTIIDNLISDRNFDFSQPAPTPVDFNILKKSTSRVPVVKAEGDEFLTPPEPIKEEAKTETKEVPLASDLYLTEEQRKIQHENYIKLVAEPVQKPAPTPAQDTLETDRYIYINKPEAERDYRNILNNLFVKTVKTTPTPQTPPVGIFEAPTKSLAEPTIQPVSDAISKAQTEGLNVGTTTYSTKSQSKKFNRGVALLRSSTIVFAILLFTFAFSLIFRQELGVTLAYSFTIFSIACAVELVFLVFYYLDKGKIMRKPTSLTYLSACFVISIIAIAIIVITGVLIGTTFTSPAEIMANIVIPCIVALNIPIFGCLYYIFSR